MRNKSSTSSTRFLPFFFFLQQFPFSTSVDSYLFFPSCPLSLLVLLLDCRKRRSGRRTPRNPKATIRRNTFFFFCPLPPFICVNLNRPCFFFCHFFCSRKESWKVNKEKRRKICLCLCLCFCSSFLIVLSSWRKRPPVNVPLLASLFFHLD